MAKEFIERSHINTTKNIYADNLGFMCHTNSYRSLKNKPYVPAYPFYHDTIETAYATLSNEGEVIKKYAYTSKYPESKYKAIGLGGYRIINDSSGKNAKYCRLLGASIEDDDARFYITNKKPESNVTWKSGITMKDSVTSKVKVQFIVVYIMRDAEAARVAKKNVECSQVEFSSGGYPELYFFAGTNRGIVSSLSNVKLQHWTKSGGWESVGKTKLELETGHLIVRASTKCGGDDTMKHYRIIIS